jgi:predicted phosphohydrolase
MVEADVAPVCRPDYEVAREFNLRLDQDLETFSRDQAVNEIVVVTHYPPFSELSILGIPFPGSRDTEGILFSHPKVSISISGHLHDKRDVLVRGIRALRCPVGYISREDGKYQEVVKNCLEVIHFIDHNDFLPKAQA